MLAQIAQIVALGASRMDMSAQDVSIPALSPHTICADSDMQLSGHLGEPDLGLAVRLPSGKFLYIADHNSMTTISFYWKSDPIQFRVRDLYGVDYDEVTGKPFLRKVFQQPGAYQFVLAENLHTEPENTISFRFEGLYGGPHTSDCRGE